MPAKIWVGAVVILLEEPPIGGPRIDLDHEDKFRDKVMDLPGAKEFMGPLINGIYAMTYEIDDLSQIDALKEKIARIWIKYAR